LPRDVPLRFQVARCRRSGVRARDVRSGDGRAGHIAIDGKTLKGSRRLDARPLHVLSAFATELGAVIGDLAVEPDQNEITAAMALLKELPLEGAVITGVRSSASARSAGTSATRTGIICSSSKTTSPS
jgi:hypothetical protein